ncbi:hypothetical protein TPHA_0C04960 [Tetrapisispora phaffii CBS 4417]|uniref:VPS9 domain-containing protein n=1 Tax=Tetrapisispora phaffii (strain ATCC 24235 / CBS 4417 / NBRC 1672 / NRRL Y-8282 / UCD 70-5) TaxID=1071381 RepID=G8BQY2_TETPH|nr:hypothetical protein TPHA_0C04960 [Tetrapisispora phaffii CBS 4417]CCE62644.1 hypothetical protein TPHA_0C04960 [Tetrapisispora phaffii CBS 4417]
MSFKDNILNEFDPLANNNNASRSSDSASNINEPHKESIDDENKKTNDGGHIKPVVNKNNVKNTNKDDINILSDIPAINAERETETVVSNNLKEKHQYGDNDRVNNADHLPVAQINETKEEIDSNDNYYDFQEFLEQFKKPTAEPLVKYTRSFLHNFLTQRSIWTTKEQTKLINDFKVFIFDKFLIYEPFKSMDKTSLNNAQEGIEKLIMGKLYNNCYSPNLKKLLKNKLIKLDDGHEQDLEDDLLIKRKFSEFGFIKPTYLDISFKDANKKSNIIIDRFINISGQELDKINKFKSPRDKIVCILNSCKVIFSILKHNKLEQNGADSFIPFLIYSLLKNKIMNLPSNLNYIERFRHEKFIKGEASYYFSSLQAAVNFIMNMDKSSLTIDNEEEFDKLYQDNQVKLKLMTEEIEKEKEHVEKVRSRHISQTSPSEYITKPLDEAANALAFKFNDLISTFSDPMHTHNTEVSEISVENANSEESDDLDYIVGMINDKENRHILKNLTSMFPDMLPEIIEDICLAKKYNLGECVDALLSLSD